MDRIEKLTAILAADPGDSFVRHALALEYVKANRDEDARAAFDDLLRRDEGYVGSYYHLAKLLERNGDREAAATCYQKGMAVAKAANDRHAYNELSSAYEDLLD